MVDEIKKKDGKFPVAVVPIYKVPENAIRTKDLLEWQNNKSTPEAKIFREAMDYPERRLIVTKRKVNMETILAIDPGTTESAYVLFEEGKIIAKDKIGNDELIRLCKISDEFNVVAIEMIASYGMPVGKSVFETCLFIGKLQQICDDRGIKNELVYRRDIKMYLCNSARAKDSNVTQALIDKYAPHTRNKGKGTKKEPGYFYGFYKDIWQAMAVCDYYYSLTKRE